MNDRYRVMNLPAGQIQRLRPNLGQTPVPAPNADQLEASSALASARKAETNVRATFSRLVSLLGEDRARQALAEAQESVAAAEAEYQALWGGA